MLSATRADGERRRTILLVRQLSASFIDTDLELLRRHFDVTDCHYRRYRHPARRLISWILRNRREFDLVLVWFGDVHATVAASAAFLLRKPCVLIVGGYDASSMPSHGFLSTRKGRLLAGLHFTLCSRILPVSDALLRDLLAFRPRTATKARALPTGCDTEFWRPGSGPRETVLSAGLAEDWHRAYVKGLDRVVECARRLPHRRVEIVGLEPVIWPRLGALPPNCSISAPIPREALRARYQAASVYLQLSRSEGFPTVVLEAMACGCVPVVANVGGMPELVGDAGFIVDGDDPNAVAAAVEKAFGAVELRARARERIERHFSLRQREDGLVREITNLV